VSFTWNAVDTARRFVGALGDATVGLGTDEDGVWGTEEPPVAATTAPIPPSSRIRTPTTITTMGHRRRCDGAALEGGGGASVGDAGRPCDPSGGGGNSSIGSLSPSFGHEVLTRENRMRDDAP
jgi:hypothetical protein